MLRKYNINTEVIYNVKRPNRENYQSHKRQFRDLEHVRKTTHFLELLAGMTKRELVARYKNTLFGFLWVVINPLMQMLVIGFIFRFFIKEPIENYYLYLLVGLLVWNFFSLSLSKATPSIVNERNLIKKAKFPREVIPLSIILSNFTHLLIAFSILLVPVLFLGILSVHNIPRLIEGIILLLSFTTGLSLLTSALDVRFRDMNFFVQAILVVWFYATPVVYSIQVIPHQLIWIWRLNPMTSIVQLFQNALVSAPPPGIGMLLSNVAVITFIAIAGISTFKKEGKNFDDWV
jgi:ABC-2 type transport system permease protein